MAAVTKFMESVPKLRAFGDSNPRQASPLWVRPIQLDERFGLLLTVLVSSFKGANYETVRNFLEEKYKGDGITVEGWNA
jgi:hypothetical protein